MKYIFILLCSINLCAQDTTISLKEIPIIYNISNTPTAYQELNINFLNQNNVGQEPSFILSKTPSITNYSDAGSNQGYSYFRIRGIDQTRINVTLDGMPLNEPEDQGCYFSNYTDLLNSISKIQIEKGVGTAKNGTSSYGGSIQLYSPILTDKENFNFGVSYGSFNTLRGYGEYNSGIKNNKAMYVRYSSLHSDGYKYKSSNNSNSLFLSNVFYNKKYIFKTNVIAGRQRNELAWLGVSDSLIQIDRKTNANNNEYDKFYQYLIQTQLINLINNRSSIKSSLYHIGLKGDYDFNYNNYIGIPNKEIYNYAFVSNLIGFFSTYNYDLKNLNVSTGINSNIYNRKHTGSEKQLGELYTNTGYKNDYSLFTKIKYSLNKTNLFSDIQYRYASFSYKGSTKLDKLDWAFINTKIGISHSILKNTVLYYSIGNTNREPTRNDIFGGNDDLLQDSLGNAIIFNSIPESVVENDLGIRYFSKNLQINLNAYNMRFKNEIALDGKFGPNGLALTNKVKKSIRCGVELHISYLLNKNIELTNNSSYNYSEILEQGEKFIPILSPKFIINQEISYRLNRFKLILSARYQDKSFINYSNTSSIPGYFLLNSTLSYTLKQISVGFYVNNLTNAKYFNNGYEDFDKVNKYFVQEPINFNICFKYTL